MSWGASWGGGPQIGFGRRRAGGSQDLGFCSVGNSRAGLTGDRARELLTDWCRVTVMVGMGALSAGTLTEARI